MKFKLILNKSRLVFEGVKDKMIHLDLYLLELDPDAPYPQYISKADAKKGIRLGDSTYQLLKVNKTTLQLKIVDLYRSQDRSISKPHGFIITQPQNGYLKDQRGQKYRLE